MTKIYIIFIILRTLFFFPVTLTPRHKSPLVVADPASVDFKHGVKVKEARKAKKKVDGNSLVDAPVVGSSSESSFESESSENTNSSLSR